MKTIVIQLDAHDDLISVRDKMVWSKAQRILLVWPKQGHPNLSRKYDLVSLQRHATALGAQLGLVTREMAVSANARELGVAQFRSEKQAQRQRWNRTRVRRRFRRRQQKPDRVASLRDEMGDKNPPAFLLAWSRLVIFTVGVLAVLAMGIFLLPGATIQIQPVQKDQTVTMTLTVDPLLSTPSLNGIIPADKVSTIVEVQGQLPTTGRASIPDQKASGIVTITNLSNQPLTLSAGSVVTIQSPVELRFITKREVALPGGEGKTVDVPVEAMANGAAGNIPADRIFSLEGPMGPNVVVSNTAAFTGGKDRSLPAVSKSDYDKLHQQLMDTLQKSAIQDLSASLGEGQILLDGTLVLEQVLEESALPAVGNPGDLLSLSLRAEFSGLSISKLDLEQLAKISMDAKLPDTEIAIPSTLAIDISSAPVLLPDGRMEWKVIASRKTITNLPEETLLKAVLSKRPSVAIGNLTELMDLKSPPVIQLTPSWWFWMPSMGFRIQFEVQ